jgi:hypothetical protein
VKIPNIKFPTIPSLDLTKIDAQKVLNQLPRIPTDRAKEMAKEQLFLYIIRMEKVEMQMIIINEFGEFIGKKFIVSKEDYDNIIKIARQFYSNGSFDLTCEDGSFMVFAPEIVQKSILKIKKTILEDV